ncbi:hypothetical protein IFM89_004197 [Coptis chinensis]|uniref:Phosphoglycerate mutase family protein n=1 Tax=Coptis chinensis TaxID=261450 RepID=A0A835LI96_9MAGN|nr:hypothetical protein IFM89_004197 [Coptis chinensis]
MKKAIYHRYNQERNVSNNSETMDYIPFQQDLQEREQHIIVMRHGDRLDTAQPSWRLTAKRPWDPPLLKLGKSRAFNLGKLMKKDLLSVQIDRVIVSPFIRCVETASEIVTALCTIKDNVDFYDPSKVKVCFELGLSEIFNSRNLGTAALRKVISFDLPKLEAMFPAGTVDHTAEPVNQIISARVESSLDAMLRYTRVIRELADKYPYENLLLVTHKYGVVTAVSGFMDNTYVHRADVCGYSHLKRKISFSPSDDVIIAGKYEVMTSKTGESGVEYCPLSERALYD